MSGGPDSKGNREQEISAISRGLKSLSKELEIPIIALSQLSRNVETRIDKKPMLSDLRESGSIEQDADLVLLLHKDESYNSKTLENETYKLIEILIAKQRNGPVDEVKASPSCASSGRNSRGPRGTFPPKRPRQSQSGQSIAVGHRRSFHWRTGSLLQTAKAGKPSYSPVSARF